MTTSRRIVDILIQSPDGDMIAVVEVKNLRDLTRDEAIQLRQSLVRYGLPAEVPFFMLLSQDIGFLWKDSTYENLDVAPAYTFPMQNVVARFSNRKPGERLYEEEFEILALRWLNFLTIKEYSRGEEPEKTLELSGFIGAIEGAYPLFEAEV